MPNERLGSRLSSPGFKREARAHIQVLMDWEDGEVEFRVEPVEREDKIGMETQGLLLDLAVAQDEARAAAGG